jgi:hypothetical protein
LWHRFSCICFTYTVSPAESNKHKPKWNFNVEWWSLRIRGTNILLPLSTWPTIVVGVRSFWSSDTT